MKRKPKIAGTFQYPADAPTPYVKVDVNYPIADQSASSPDADTLGDLRDVVQSDTVSYASSVALVYHGYRRTGSIVWALLYGLAGKKVPAVAVPVALAQGFGRRKPCP